MWCAFRSTCASCEQALWFWISGYSEWCSGNVSIVCPASKSATLQVISSPISTVLHVPFSAVNTVLQVTVSAMSSMSYVYTLSYVYTIYNVAEHQTGEFTDTIHLELRIEPSASSILRGCSTTELLRGFFVRSLSLYIASACRICGHNVPCERTVLTM